LNPFNFWDCQTSIPRKIRTSYFPKSLTAYFSTNYKFLNAAFELLGVVDFLQLRAKVAICNKLTVIMFLWNVAWFLWYFGTGVKISTCYRHL